MSSQTLRQTIAAFWLGAYGVAAISQVPVPLPDGSEAPIQARLPVKTTTQKMDDHDAQLTFDDGQKILAREHQSRLLESRLTYVIRPNSTTGAPISFKRTNKASANEPDISPPKSTTKPSPVSLPLKGTK